MSKKNYIEVQKGPIDMSQQYNYKFCREPEMTRQDIEYREMRQAGKTLTYHEPKR